MSLENKSTSLVAVLAWIIVTIPLGWGVYQSVVKSRPLFGAPPTLQPSHPVGK